MILNEIVRSIENEIERRKQTLPQEILMKMVVNQSPPVDLTAAVCGNGIKVIAEIKKASPSRGIIRDDFNHIEIARIYADNGVAAISVLTEPEYFKGSIQYLRDIRAILGKRKLPLLRKDFIISSYQIYESRAYGADCLLLIAAILSPHKLKTLLSLSQELGMKCIVEVHNEEDLKIALNSKARIIGINNRDLNTFKVDLNTTRRLKPLIPSDRIVVSESGIKEKSDIERLKQWGINAVLIGEALMSAPDISAKLKELND